MSKMVSPNEAMFELERARIDSVKESIRKRTFKSYPSCGFSMSILKAIEELQEERFKEFEKAIKLPIKVRRKCYE